MKNLTNMSILYSWSNNQHSQAIICANPRSVFIDGSKDTILGLKTDTMKD